jgi:hypothetical protein
MAINWTKEEKILSVSKSDLSLTVMALVLALSCSSTSIDLQVTKTPSNVITVNSPTPLNMLVFLDGNKVYFLDGNLAVQV